MWIFQNILQNYEHLQYAYIANTILILSYRNFIITACSTFLSHKQNKTDLPTLKNQHKIYRTCLYKTYFSIFPIKFITFCSELL